jgi:hypothetical protein
MTMTTTTMIRAWRAIACASMIAVAREGGAQTLAARVAAARQGTVEMHFAARPGACGDGRYMLSLGHSMMIGSSDEWGRNGRHATCLAGPVRARLELTDGVVRDVHAYVGPLPAPAPGVTDLGEVRAADAASYFLELARTGDGRASDRAIMPAVLADSAVVWRALLAIARDSSRRSHSARNSASFWLSRFASARLAGHPDDLSSADDEEETEGDPRGSAVFALSQLRNHEGIAPLIQVARTNPSAHVRGQALFWLGQSGDARALGLFEEILR